MRYQGTPKELVRQWQALRDGGMAVQDIHAIAGEGYKISTVYKHTRPKKLIHKRPKGTISVADLRDALRLADVEQVRDEMQEGDVYEVRRVWNDINGRAEQRRRGKVIVKEEAFFVLQFKHTKEAYNYVDLLVRTPGIAFRKV